MSDAHGHETVSAGHGGEAGHGEGGGYTPVPLSKILTPVAIVLAAMVGIDASSGGDHGGGGHGGGHDAGGHAGGGHDSHGEDHGASEKAHTITADHGGGHGGGHDAHPTKDHGKDDHAKPAHGDGHAAPPAPAAGAHH